MTKLIKKATNIHNSSWIDNRWEKQVLNRRLRFGKRNVGRSGVATICKILPERNGCDMLRTG